MHGCVIKVAFMVRRWMVRSAREREREERGERTEADARRSVGRSGNCVSRFRSDCGARSIFCIRNGSLSKKESPLSLSLVFHHHSISTFFLLRRKGERLCTPSSLPWKDRVLATGNKIVPFQSHWENSAYRLPPPLSLFSSLRSSFFFPPSLFPTLHFACTRANHFVFLSFSLSLFPTLVCVHISRNEADFGTGYLFRTNEFKNRVPSTRIRFSPPPSSCSLSPSRICREARWILHSAGPPPPPPPSPPPRSSIKRARRKFLADSQPLPRYRGKLQRHRSSPPSPNRRVPSSQPGHTRNLCELINPHPSRGSGYLERKLFELVLP